MASGVRPLPKFGEWDVNNPASSEGFTVIFNKARDDKKTRNVTPRIITPRAEDPVNVPINKKDSASHHRHSPKRKWLCCG